MYPWSTIHQEDLSDDSAFEGGSEDEESSENIEEDEDASE
ncbi:unnamed protein product [Haemonchus placei]|uniref:Uncharacterized protein n=1 Tax=Haemonchus placei TaxID=6290 RepID=A0A0N4WZ40_HAEPC|nr:unnamed protein product [Haemonchus placei]